MTATLQFHRQTAGSVLIVVLIVCIGLVSMTLVLGHTMLMAYRGADNEVAGRQADAAIEGAVQYAEQQMTNVDERGEMPDPEDYESEAVPVGDAMYWFIGEPDPSDTSNLPAFGLVDEASKVNLNTAPLAMLENLPGMTEDLAEAIIAWRNSSSSAPSPGTSSATTTSTIKNAPFESVEELAQVDGGTDLEILYGNDTNLNHVFDPSEAADGSTEYSPGLLEYVTVFSREPNTLSDGRKRVDVTQFSAALTQLLVATFGTSRGNQIATTVRKASPSRSVLEFYFTSHMTRDEFAKISPMLTTGSGAYVKGLINVNTASATVLECVPGITSDLANQIISTRESQETPVTNLGWVASILGPAVSAQAGPYLTAQTFQISADIAAVGRNGRGYRRTLFILDNSNGTPQIVFRRNLTYLGWALGADERQNLATAQGSPTP
jgi:DNA uptake protein ComE-like DNA-binding protein